MKNFAYRLTIVIKFKKLFMPTDLFTLEQIRFNFCFQTCRDSGLHPILQAVIVHTWTICHFYQSSLSFKIHSRCGSSLNLFSVYFSVKVLEISSGIGAAGEVRFELAMCLLLGWIIVYFCVWKGIKSAGKVSLYFDFCIVLRQIT